MKTYFAALLVAISVMGTPTIGVAQQPATVNDVAKGVRDLSGGLKKEAQKRQAVESRVTALESRPAAPTTSPAGITGAIARKIVEDQAVELWQTAHGQIYRIMFVAFGLTEAKANEIITEAGRLYRVGKKEETEALLIKTASSIAKARADGASPKVDLDALKREVTNYVMAELNTRLATLKTEMASSTDAKVKAVADQLPAIREGLTNLKDKVEKPTATAAGDYGKQLAELEQKVVDIIGRLDTLEKNVPDGLSDTLDTLRDEIAAARQQNMKDRIFLSDLHPKEAFRRKLLWMETYDNNGEACQTLTVEEDLLLDYVREAHTDKDGDLDKEEAADWLRKRLADTLAVELAKKL